MSDNPFAKYYVGASNATSLPEGGITSEKSLWEVPSQTTDDYFKNTFGLDSLDLNKVASTALQSPTSSAQNNAQKTEVQRNNLLEAHEAVQSLFSEPGKEGLFPEPEKPVKYDTAGVQYTPAGFDQPSMLKEYWSRQSGKEQNQWAQTTLDSRQREEQTRKNLGNSIAAQQREGLLSGQVAYMMQGDKGKALPAQNIPVKKPDEPTQLNA